MVGRLATLRPGGACRGPPRRAAAVGAALTRAPRRRRAAHRPRPGLRQRLASVHALALAALEPLVGPGSSVLDVGCGSGVLAVAAARLGAGRVVAIDVDPAAHAATLDNAARNGVEVSVPRVPLSEVSGRFDVVLANLLTPTLIELAAPLGERVAEHGALVVSGLLPQQTERVFAALAPLVVVGETELDGWVAATLSG